VAEFHYGGQAGVEYPADPAALDDAQWGRYLFFRANPKGTLAERWCHTAGCRRWFSVLRDTLTHQVSGAVGVPAAVGVPGPAGVSVPPAGSGAA
jgi:heterotetrameric sarcosine oxidase delta subunit